MVILSSVVSIDPNVNERQEKGQYARRREGRHLDQSDNLNIERVINFAFQSVGRYVGTACALDSDLSMREGYS